MEESPRICSSKKRIVYKTSAWRVHQFEIWSGELVCSAVALRLEGALLLWLGGSGPPLLNEIVLGMPPREDLSREALATALLGGERSAGALARRLASLLSRPVYVCTGLTFDRFITPLVERGLVAEIKSRPDCFM